MATSLLPTNARPHYEIGVVHFGLKSFGLVFQLGIEELGDGSHQTIRGKLDSMANALGIDDSVLLFAASHAGPDQWAVVGENSLIPDVHDAISDLRFSRYAVAELS